MDIAALSGVDRALLILQAAAQVNAVGQLPRRGAHERQRQRDETAELTSVDAQGS